MAVGPSTLYRDGSAAMDVEGVNRAPPPQVTGPC